MIGQIGRTLWRCKWPLAVLCGLAAYAVLLPTAWMYAGSGRYRASAADVPPAPVGLVFGAGALNNQPSWMLKGRLDVATSLYRTGKVRALLVSGDNSRKDYDEPTVMRDYLTAHGVPVGKIVLDYAGFDTWDSCVRAHKIFGVGRAILVTQDFHLPRAVTLCRTAGIDAWGVADSSSRYPATTTDSLYLREVPAAMKAMYDVIAHPRPYFLGPRETGVQQALR